MSSTPQILLPLESRRPDRFEDYIPGPNQHAVSALIELLQLPEGCLFIRGPEGSGKTHLLNAACNSARQQGLQSFYIALGTMPDAAADGLAGLEEMHLVCLDDVDLVAGKPAWERALFHFFNRIRERLGRLVVSSTQPLSAVQFQLPDLASRLAWGPRLQLETLDDQGKEEILRRKALAVGIELPSDVAKYLLSRGSRTIPDLLANFEAVRVAALKEKRKITIPLVRQALTAD